MEKNTITELETKVIENLINSEYMNESGKEIIDYPVWSFSVTEERKDLAGALGSLVKKGLMACLGKSDGDEICSITEEGYKVATELKLI